MNQFSEVVGHKRIINHLENAITRKKPSHAYIFYGEDGCGKRMVADIFAAGLLCMGEGNKPCGKCRSCLQFETANHPDVFRVTHEKSVIGVDDIRSQLVNEMQIKPYSSEYKIFIVDEAERMNEQAQNALLKTLEEPPEYGIIILLSNNINAFLDTILSRSIALPFLPAGRDEIVKFLIGKKHVPDYQAKLAAACSGGSPGLALRWVDSEEFSERRERSLELLRKIGKLDSETVFVTSGEWAKEKEEILFFIRLFRIWIRDILYIKSVGKNERCMFSEEKRVLEAQEKMLSYERLEELLEGADTLEGRLESNVNTEISFENFLLLFR
ncbi:MAG: DNA polymerase III subunit delta' [Lachnospiraceae bacterium]